MIFKITDIFPKKRSKTSQNENIFFSHFKHKEFIYLFKP